MRLSYVAVFFALLLGFADVAHAQLPASPRGQAQTQIGSREGPWITVDYGRPILRGRTNIFGSGEEYGKSLYAGAPVWRLGANQSTSLMTETDLMIGGQHVPAGTYTMFAELNSPTSWTLIISNHKGKVNPRDENEEGIWGSYGYSPDMDVARATMQTTSVDASVDQLSIVFMDVSANGGLMGVVWGNTMAMVPFQVH
ncbi:MAG: DUF2911 domain-containing protein [Rhodothermales bacterium]|nr:DUF2911 domain-containing protein [Rhodothermales bacterium]MBO6778721.1 DUF2911 domain-containing protein [Rhodothermales bacterium]